MSTLFKTEEARNLVMDWHERFRTRLKVETESRVVDTTFGEPHLLVAGPRDAKPLIALHGALASSAHIMVELGPLLTKYRVYAVDVIGQSAKSANVRLSVSNNDYGNWLTQVMDGLSLPAANVLGVSWGGFVAIRLAAVALERVESLSLIVPAGLVKTPMKNNFKVGLPMTLFLMSPNPTNKQRFLATQLTTLDDEDWTEYLATAFHAYKMNMKIPPLVRPQEMANLKAPVFIAGADRDLSFPGDKLLAQAAQVFPNLTQAELILDSSHCPPTTDEFRQWLGGKLSHFIG